MNVYRGARAILAYRHPPLLLTQHRFVRRDENFTFDWDLVPDTLDKERKKYEEYSDLVGNAKFSREANVETVDYVASQNPDEWSHVERLLEIASPKLVPGMRLKPFLHLFSGIHIRPMPGINI